MGVWGQEKFFNCLEHDFGSVREYLVMADAFWEGKFYIRMAAGEGILLPPDSRNWDQVPALSWMRMSMKMQVLVT